MDLWAGTESATELEKYQRLSGKVGGDISACAGALSVRGKAMSERWSLLRRYLPHQLAALGRRPPLRKRARGPRAHPMGSGARRSRASPLVCRQKKFRPIWQGCKGERSAHQRDACRLRDPASRLALVAALSAAVADRDGIHRPRPDRGKRWGISISWTSPSGARAKLVTPDEARRMPPTSPSCRSSHRPVSTHFRYDLNSGHFAGLRSLTSWARSDQTPLDAPV